MDITLSAASMDRLLQLFKQEDWKHDHWFRRPNYMSIREFLDSFHPLVIGTLELDYSALENNEFKLFSKAIYQRLPITPRHAVILFTFFRWKGISADLIEKLFSVLLTLPSEYWPKLYIDLVKGGTYFA